MPKENEKQRVFTRRAAVLGAVQAVMLGALASRLFYLQFIRTEEYKTLSESNRIKLQLIAPERGLILDRLGVPMATNEKTYRLFINMGEIKPAQYQASIEKLHGLLPFTEKRLEQLRKMRPSESRPPELLRDHLTWEEVSLIELNLLGLPGVFIDVGQVRYYPFGEKFSHLLGYMGAVAEDEMEEQNKSLFRLPGFKIGKNGVEKLLEEDLRGKPGIRQLEVNVHGVGVREISKTPSISGDNIRLTIDGSLQDYAAERIAGESASVVVMEAATGNILTLVSIPGYDPNSFSKGIGIEEWKRLNADKKSPLLNKAIAGQYPPGSTFKMIVGLAALRADIIKPWNSVFCPGHFMLGNHRFNCWKEEGHGSMNFHDAVAQSCDTYFYTVAHRMGIQKYADLAREFGLGQRYDIGLIGEKSGIIPDPAWKMKSYNQRWAGGDTINCSIGQGYVLTTPLQLAVMTARMATGKRIIPRLWVKDGHEQPQFARMLVEDELLELNREAMAAVVNTPGGTAYGKRIMEPHLAFGGKTGTSQVRRITQRGMNQDLLPWEHRHHALFVGYAPLDRPKYVASVLVEHGGGGSATAAPIARDVLRKVQEIGEAKG